MSGDTPEGWEPVDWIATNVCESIDGLLIGHDVFGEAWDDAGMVSRRVFLCEVAGFVRNELEGTEVERLRAASVVLDSIVDALVDPNRPEESPVDAVRRIIADNERLTEQGKQDAAVIDGFAGDLARLTDRLRERGAALEGERDDARRRFLDRVAGAAARAEPEFMAQLASNYGWLGLYDGTPKLPGD